MYKMRLMEMKNDLERYLLRNIRDRVEELFAETMLEGSPQVRAVIAALKEYNRLTPFGGNRYVGRDGETL